MQANLDNNIVVAKFAELLCELEPLNLDSSTLEFTERVKVWYLWQEHYYESTGKQSKQGHTPYQ